MGGFNLPPAWCPFQVQMRSSQASRLLKPVVKLRAEPPRKGRPNPSLRTVRRKEHHFSTCLSILGIARFPFPPIFPPFSSELRPYSSGTNVGAPVSDSAVMAGKLLRQSRVKTEMLCPHRGKLHHRLRIARSTAKSFTPSSSSRHFGLILMSSRPMCCGGPACVQHGDPGEAPARCGSGGPHVCYVTHKRTIAAMNLASVANHRPQNASPRSHVWFL